MTDSLDCAALDSVLITVDPQFPAEVGNDTIICYGDSAERRLILFAYRRQLVLTILRYPLP